MGGAGLRQVGPATRGSWAWQTSTRASAMPCGRVVVSFTWPHVAWRQYGPCTPSRRPASGGIASSCRKRGEKERINGWRVSREKMPGTRL